MRRPILHGFDYSTACIQTRCAHSGRMHGETWAAWQCKFNTLTLALRSDYLQARLRALRASLGARSSLGDSETLPALPAASDTDSKPEPPARQDYTVSNQPNQVGLNSLQATCNVQASFKTPLAGAIQVWAVGARMCAVQAAFAVNAYCMRSIFFEQPRWTCT